MVSTAQLHMEAFDEVLEYLYQHVDKYSIVLPNSQEKWIPLDFIKYIYREDKNFRFRLARFIKGLTSRDFCEVDDEEIMDLVEGNMGNQFLSWDMTMCLFLHEGRGSWPTTKKGKEKVHEAALVTERVADDKEEILSDAQEASMALVMLQGGDHPTDMDVMIEGDDVVEAVPELDVERLLPILIDGVEYLFLDDICKALGFREDEALFDLAQVANVEAGPSTEPPTSKKLDLRHDGTLSSKLDFISYNHMSSIDETVAAALVAIKSVEEEYNLVPESAFQPHTQLIVQHANDKRLGSINIAGPALVENDDESSVSCILH